MSEDIQLTEGELASLRRFDEGDGGWGEENASRLMDLGLVDFEESIDGSTFWVTGKGQSFL